MTPPVKRPRWRRLDGVDWSMAIFIVLVCVAASGIRGSGRDLDYWANFTAFAGRFLPPDWSVLPDVGWAMLETARIALVATAVAAVAISVEFCVLIGVFLSFLLAVPRAGQAVLTEFVAGPDGVAHERFPGDPGSDPILIFGLEGEMFFGAAPNLERHFESIEARILPSTQVLVLRLKRFRTPDAVGMHLLEDFLARVRGRGVTVLTCGVRDELYRAFEKTGLAEELAPEHVFREEPVRQTSTMLAVRHAYALVDGAHAARGA